LTCPAGQFTVDGLRLAAGNAALPAAQVRSEASRQHGDGLPTQVDALALDGAADRAALLRVSRLRQLFSFFDKKNSCGRIAAGSFN
jgi:hypothetical protein